MVTKCSLPSSSRLHEYANPSDFLDCYAISSDHKLDHAAQILMAFPSWVRGLMWMRNMLVRPLGLNTEPVENEHNIGIFPVESESLDEIVAGFDDRHLNFRISVLKHCNKIHLATWVHPHNLLGHIYLAGVMPFHIVIVRNALHRLSKSPVIQ